MAKGWAIGLLGLGMAAPAAFGQPREAPPATEVLCSQLQTLEQAALQSFYPVMGKRRKILKVFGAGPIQYDTSLVLAEADECYIRPSGLRGRNEYYCVWHSEKPQFAAPDYAKRIARCLGADLRLSDFTNNIVAVTRSKVNFSVGADDKWNHNQVRLLVNVP